MQYYNFENAEYLMRQIVNKNHEQAYFRDIAVHNGTKCACDGYRLLTILSENAKPWDFSAVYFDADGGNNGKSAIGRVFDAREKCSSPQIISKEEAARIIISTDAAKIDYNRRNEDEKSEIASDIIVCFNAKSESADSETVTGFNSKYIEETIKFAMCSNDESIEIYFCGSLSPLIIKSGRLYAAVLPVKARSKQVQRHVIRI